MDSLKEQKGIQTFFVTFWVGNATNQTNEEALFFILYFLLVIVIVLTWIL